MLIRFVSIRLIFARSKRLAIWEIKEIVPIVRLVYYTLVDNTCINMSKIEDIAGTEFDELLQQVHLGELDLVDYRINQRLDMSEEMLGVVSALADDALQGCQFVPKPMSVTN